METEFRVGNLVRAALALALLLAVPAASGVTVRSRDDMRLWQTVFDRDAPLVWNWEDGADAATVTFRPFRANAGGLVRYGAGQVTCVARTETDGGRGRCFLPVPFTNDLVEVVLCQTGGGIEVARAVVELAFVPGAGQRGSGNGVASRAITVRTKTSGEWHRAPAPHPSGFAGDWWGLEAGSGYEVFWWPGALRRQVVREFAGAGVVDATTLRFGDPGFCLSVQ